MFVLRLPTRSFDRTAANDVTEEEQAELSAKLVENECGRGTQKVWRSSISHTVIAMKRVLQAADGSFGTFLYIHPKSVTNHICSNNSSIFFLRVEGKNCQGWGPSITSTRDIQMLGTNFRPSLNVKVQDNMPQGHSWFKCV